MPRKSEIKLGITAELPDYSELYLYGLAKQYFLWDIVIVVPFKYGSSDISAAQ